MVNHPSVEEECAYYLHDELFVGGGDKWRSVDSRTKVGGPILWREVDAWRLGGSRGAIRAKTGKTSRNVIRHICDQCIGRVVPLKTDANVLRPSAVFAYLVFLDEVGNERLVVSDVTVFDTKIIDDKSERDASGGVGEKTRDVRVLDVTSGCKMVYKVLVG